MSFKENNKSEEEKKIERDELVATLNRYDEERKRREKEENQKKIGEFTVQEFKIRVTSIIQEQAYSGNLPLLNKSRKKKLEKWLWIGGLITLLSFISYQVFWRESGYSVDVNKDKLFLIKSIGWNTEKRK